MQFRIPKNTKQFFWTKHVLEKMRYYGLSVQKVLGVINRPIRKEDGIVKNTIAVMQPISPKIKDGKKIWKQEIWCMYQLCNSKAISKSQFPISKQEPNSNSESYKPKTINYKRKIISAWRYPGVSPKKNPIPEEILREASEELEDVV